MTVTRWGVCFLCPKRRPTPSYPWRPGRSQFVTPLRIYGGITCHIRQLIRFLDGRLSDCVHDAGSTNNKQQTANSTICCTVACRCMTEGGDLTYRPTCTLRYLNDNNGQSQNTPFKLTEHVWLWYIDIRDRQTDGQAPYLLLFYMHCSVLQWSVCPERQNKP